MPTLDYSEHYKRQKEPRIEYELIDKRSFANSYTTFITPKERQGPLKYFVKSKRTSLEAHEAVVEDFAGEFYKYSRAWEEEIGGVSSLSEITGNMNYLRIIAMGERALPFIFAELSKRPAPWFVALRAITRNDRVGADYPGDFRKKGMAWLEWGKKNGYL